MESFSAVVTTGIYCRPSCGARPRADHVTKFALAAAAEAAGYRACLRCRPYRTSQPLSSNAPEVVCRAVRLILDGALDRGTEGDLASRLAVSSRHLRRLFVTHLGVTPIALARSARAHFARRLLDDTDLTITEIAFASGFGSLRQFNRVFQEVFRDSPRALRARRRSSDRLVADGGLVLRLPFHGLLDWQAMLSYLAAHAITGIEAVADETYRRTIVVKGNPGVLEITSGSDDHLLLRAHLPHWDELVHLVERARRIADIEFDPAEAVTQLGGEPIVGPLLRARPGVRIPGIWDPFETGVRFVLGQEVPTSRANALAARLVARAGRPVGGLEPLGLSHTFPSPETLADADLDGLGLAPARVEAIRAFARTVAEDRVRLDGSVCLDDLIASLTAIDGINCSTAHHLALRLGERDAFPTSGLAVQPLFAKKPLPSVPLTEVAEAWRPWRALAFAHLWLAVREADREPVAA